MNNEIEYNSLKTDDIEKNLKNLFLSIIVNDIPSNKRNAIIYLKKLMIDMENESKDIYGFVSNTICKKIINDLIEKISDSKNNSRLNIKELVKSEMTDNEIEFYECDEDISDIDIDEEIERLQNRKKQKIDKEFIDLIKINNKEEKNDLNFFKNLELNEKNNYIEKLKNLNNTSYEKPFLLKLIDLDTSDKNKKIILEKINTFNSLEKNSGEYCKLNNWLNNIFKVPFGKYIDITENLNTKRKINNKLQNISNTLNSTIYGHEIAKNKILKYVAELTNNKNVSNIITLEGPPGIGKTALIQNGISKAFNLPFNFISLGGTTDSSTIEGFDYTYEGSTYGKIIDILIRSNCMNPIIYFDELDKVSETAKGREIINVLTHITDSIQNNHFNDKYFTGIDFDLSKIIFIFSCNDLSMVNKILRDRMYTIKLSGFSAIEKVNITSNYILPDLYNNFNFKDKIIFDNDIIDYIINNYTFEGGVRKLKEKLNDILQEINLRFITNKKLLDRKIKFPIHLTKEILEDDIFKHKNKIKIEKIIENPKVGVINGLWACDYGTGGVVPIEVVFSYSDEKFDLLLTGMQGDVMQESMKVAKSVAINLLSSIKLNNLIKKLEKSKLLGLHIHCPDGSTPIDGPSAGCAIAIAIYSLFLNKKINNTVAITGELTLQGNITEIGGLQEKIYGAIKAGVKTILYPAENKHDIDEIIKKDNTIENKLNLIQISNINDAIKYIF